MRNGDRHRCGRPESVKRFPTQAHGYHYRWNRALSDSFGVLALSPSNQTSSSAFAARGAVHNAAAKAAQHTTFILVVILRPLTQVSTCPPDFYAWQPLPALAKLLLPL